MSPSSNLLADLRARNLLFQCTDEPGLDKHLSSASRRVYDGFDPTADSLTVGNLVGILALRRFQLAGHSPVVVMGGGTGLIGDPSGKSAERTLRTRDEIQHNVNSQRRIFESLLDFSPALSTKATIEDNASWLCNLSYLEALRDIGKHFSVNMMIQKDSVKERLTNRDQGISYTEFSYMILQAYDFWWLYKNRGVTVQVGGSDQYGNIVVGSDLIRRMTTGTPGTHDTFGLTTPLITKSDGGKFGKTESGAIWLTADRTSPYAFYQFWLNTDDADISKFLRTFTLFSLDEIAALESAHAADPGKREAHRALARHMTDLLHGESERKQSEAAAQALFSGDIAQLPAKILDEALAAAPTTTHAKSLLQGEGMPLLDLLALTTLADSKGKARQLLSEGSISINGQKAAPDTRLTSTNLLHARTIALRRGKKAWHITRWE